jgi:hypothetical protein
LSVRVESMGETHPGDDVFRSFALVPGGRLSNGLLCVVARFGLVFIGQESYRAPTVRSSCFVRWRSNHSRANRAT